MLSLVSRLRYLSLALAASAFATALLYLFLLMSTANWGISLLIVGSLAVFFTALSNVYDISRGELGNIWRMVVVAQVVFFFTSFLVSDRGAGLGLMSALLALAIMAQMPIRQEGYMGRIPAWVPYWAVIVGIGCYLLDINWPLQRFILFSTWLTLVWVIQSITIALFAVFSFYNFGARSLRIKLVITFLLVSMSAALPVVAYLNYATRTTLVDRESSQLLSTAQQVANELDQFVANTLQNTKVEAAFNDFKLYLSLDPRERQVGWSLVLQNTMNDLSRRDERNIVSYALLDRDGNILIASAGQDVGENVADIAYFAEALNSGEPRVSPVLAELNPRNFYEYFLYFTAPVFDDGNNITGVLRVKYKAAILQEIVARYNSQAGLNSFAILLDEYNLRLAHGRDPQQQYRMLYRADTTISELQAAGRLPSGSQDTFFTNLQDFDQKMIASDQQPVFTTYISEENERASSLSRVAVSKMKNLPWKVLFTQDEAVILQPIKEQGRVVGFLVLGIGGLLALVSLGVSTLYTSPVNRLTEAAAKIAAGNLDARANFKSYQDEFGLLALTFNNMAAQIRQNVVTLETRVAERTRDLELRAFQLQIAAETGNIVSTIRDLDKLLPEVAELLSDRFGFYHVGIFLLDEAGEYAVLQAANSQGGRQMLRRGHRLRVGETGIVGYVSATGQPRISLDVGDDAVFFNNPDLPDTRSEMALPLVARAKVIGVLDIQSEEENAFSESDVTVLQVVAEQVAVAIENARLFIELEGAVEATRRAYGEVTARAWADYTAKQPVRGYLTRGTDVIIPLVEEVSPTLSQAMSDLLRTGQIAQVDAHTLIVPIKFRDLILGAIRLQREERLHAWGEDEKVIVQNLADQLGAALENARLYRQTQRVASRDRMVREIGDRMRRAPDMDALIQTAIREMSRVLGTEHAFAQISLTPQTDNEPAGNGGSLSGGRRPSGEVL
jgi:GAF domain-containing protein/HAMP domain-containing protein